MASATSSIGVGGGLGTGSNEEMMSSSLHHASSNTLQTLKRLSSLHNHFYAKPWATQYIIGGSGNEAMRPKVEIMHDQEDDDGESWWVFQNRDYGFKPFLLSDLEHFLACNRFRFANHAEKCLLNHVLIRHDLKPFLLVCFAEENEFFKSKQRKRTILVEAALFEETFCWNVQKR